MNFRIEETTSGRELVVFQPNDNPDEDAAMRIELPRTQAEITRLLTSLISKDQKFIVSPQAIAELISGIAS